ncbi:MAG: Type 4 prepilin-like protein leader peptide-processing enzyme [Candidatus Kaiserbacteria bacterium GW2011_GWA2_49_19]|uniref:Type 4 prepilin-like protein leader peptide-processing enzyme n=1 Tax=Candidatus Kaiserbacteria bacterium GW2011_GWA2_49_19 TaxID=1618669 RepID=A0A0G1VP69_9BACT|nr:MAG: Type 4 prepilin-like protein leader peptide-processing enzyme [Candidatus Kaiserbacteria bacterium GW2011_GWA2_49_19]
MFFPSNYATICVRLNLCGVCQWSERPTKNMFIISADWFWYGLVLAAGLILGSYLNSWMWRVHEGRWQFKPRFPGGEGAQPSTIARIGGRSVCIHCQRVLAWFENIPLGSFLVLRGRCRTCRRAIPLDYFLVELAAALLFVGITYYHLHLPAFSPWHFFRDIFFSALLVVVFVYDLKYYIILPSLTLAGTTIAIFFNIQYSTVGIKYWILGAIVGGGFFALQYLISSGRWIGAGDIYLGVMMGALLGWPVILVAFFAAYILGALAAVPLLVFKKKGLKSEVPLGTFLAVGTFIAMFWGNNAIQWYWSLIR